MQGSAVGRQEFNRPTPLPINGVARPRGQLLPRAVCKQMPSTIRSTTDN